MDLRHKLLISTALMVVGALPFGFASAWAFAISNSVDTISGKAGLSDALFILVVLCGTYGLSVLVSVSSAVWTLRLVRGRHGPFSNCISYAARVMIFLHSVALVAFLYWSNR